MVIKVFSPLYGTSYIFGLTSNTLKVNKYLKTLDLFTYRQMSLQHLEKENRCFFLNKLNVKIFGMDTDIYITKLLLQITQSQSEKNIHTVQLKRLMGVA